MTAVWHFSDHFVNRGHLARAGALTNVGRGADVCPRCRRSVYMAEKVVGAGQVCLIVFWTLLACEWWWWWRLAYRHVALCVCEPVDVWI